MMHTSTKITGKSVKNHYKNAQKRDVDSTFVILLPNAMI